ADPEPEEIAEPAAEIVEEPKAVVELSEEDPEDTLDEEADTTAKPKFSARFFETLANVGGFHGRTVKVELDPSTVSLETWEGDDPVQQEEPAASEEAFSEEEPVQAEEAGQVE